MRIFLISCDSPEPLHSWQKSVIVDPFPPHLGQVLLTTNPPWENCMVPAPWHASHCDTCAPGSAPVPRHRVQSIARGTLIMVSPPSIARAKGISMRMFTSSPFAPRPSCVYSACENPRFGPWSKNMSNKSSNPPALELPRPEKISPNISEKSCPCPAPCDGCPCPLPAYCEKSKPRDWASFNCSYFARFSLLVKTSYASLISLNFSSAALFPGLASG